MVSRGVVQKLCIALNSKNGLIHDLGFHVPLAVFWLLREEDSKLDQIVGVWTGPENQLAQIFEIMTGLPSTDRTRAEEFWERYLQQICAWFVEICRFTASRSVTDCSKIEHCT